jgi:hypothetical protein
MDTKTSRGDFPLEEFVKVCNAKAFPKGLIIYGNFDFSEYPKLKHLPKDLHITGNLYATHNYTLRYLPDGLHIGKVLHIYGCPHLKVLPNGLKVEEEIYSDIFLQYPIKDIPKILHLNLFEKDRKTLLHLLENKNP